MIIARVARGGDAPHPRFAIDGWKIWSLPGHALVFVLAVDAFALILATAGLLTAHPTSTDIGRLAVLGILSGLYSEAEDRTDRFRRYKASGRTFVDAQSVWIVAAMLLLPAGYAALLIAVIYLHTAVRAHRHGSWLPHRVTFTGASVVLSASAGAAVFHAIADNVVAPHSAGRALAVVCALLTYRVVNDAAVAIVICLAARPAAFREVLLRRDELLVEIATMILGLFTAQTLVRTPWLTPAVLVLIFTMYRGLLARKFEVAAATDGKTGLLNATAWRELAQRHLWRGIREEQAAALMVIDLDRFKAVNDEHGHLAGDVALKAVADRIKHELRDYDAVSRYGGEEFVALLPNAGANAAMRVAERLRARIEDEPITIEDGTTVHLTGSVGVATYPTHGGELDELIRSADRAMYAAKDAGRNAVRLAHPSLTSQESQAAPA